MTHTPQDHRELVKMANQIGLFFESQTPDEPAVAAQALAGHLRLFWAPAMRHTLVDQFAAGEPEGALPIVAAAVRSHAADLLTPGSQGMGPGSDTFPKGGGDAG